MPASHADQNPAAASFAPVRGSTDRRVEAAPVQPFPIVGSPPGNLLRPRRFVHRPPENLIRQVRREDLLLNMRARPRPSRGERWTAAVAYALAAFVVAYFALQFVLRP